MSRPSSPWLELNTEDLAALTETDTPKHTESFICEDKLTKEAIDSWVNDPIEGRSPVDMHLPTPERLCWRCGKPGYRRNQCHRPLIKFYSRRGKL